MIPIEYATYEYCGVQRTGKSTLMNNDILYLMSGLMADKYLPDEVYVNWNLFVEGVHRCSNEQILDVLLKAKRERWKHKIIAVDEGSQVLKARSYSDKIQTEIVTTIWQMPKKRISFFYSSNPGNTVDIQLRDGTWYIVVPQIYHSFKDRSLDFIDFSVCHAYEIWENDLTFDKPAFVQQFFDSYEDIY
jgi:hypothetical protein